MRLSFFAVFGEENELNYRRMQIDVGGFIGILISERKKVGTKNINKKEIAVVTKIKSNEIGGIGKELNYRRMQIDVGGFIGLLISERKKVGTKNINKKEIVGGG